MIMEHGPDAIRSMESNGLTWTIDANAPEADLIQPDKIIFVTGRVVGRVLAVDRTGNNLRVTLGPVAITDVIKEANISADQPLDLNALIAYPAPDYPGKTTDPEAAPESGMGPEPTPVWLASTFSRTAAQVPGGLPTIGTPSIVLIDKFQITPICGGGLGVKLVHDGEGVKMMAYAVIRLHSPSLRFNLVITGGHVQTAEVELRGGTGLTVHFEAGTDAGVSGNIHQSFFVPVDFSFPIAGLPVPFSVVIRQTMTLTTSFTAQTGTLMAEGDYGFDGSISSAVMRAVGRWR